MLGATSLGLSLRTTLPEGHWRVLVYVSDEEGHFRTRVPIDESMSLLSSPPTTNAEATIEYYSRTLSGALDDTADDENPHTIDIQRVLLVGKQVVDESVKHLQDDSVSVDGVDVTESAKAALSAIDAMSNAIMAPSSQSSRLMSLDEVRTSIQSVESSIEFYELFARNHAKIGFDLEMSQVICLENMFEVTLNNILHRESAASWYLNLDVHSLLNVIQSMLRMKLKIPGAALITPLSHTETCEGLTASISQTMSLLQHVAKFGLFAEKSRRHFSDFGMFSVAAHRVMPGHNDMAYLPKTINVGLG